MRTTECPREREVLEAMVAAPWPEGVSTDLRAHVAGCRACAGLVDAAQQLLNGSAPGARPATVPTPEVMWGRMQLRARMDAARAAARPIAVTQGLAFAGVAGLLVGAVGLVSPAFRRGAVWLAETAASAASFEMPVPDLHQVGLLPIVSVVALAILVVATPVAVYLASGDE